ncbi:MAG TPA: hypothetical protein V6C65_32100 [Allocoleopsis sp.]
MFTLELVSIKVSGKDGFLFAFPDKSGELYLEKSIDPKVQSEEGMKAYKKLHSPVCKAIIRDDGVLIFPIVKEGVNPLVSQKAAMLYGKFPVSYLLNAGYLSEQMIVAHATRNLVFDLGFKADEAKSIADQAWKLSQESRKNQRIETRLNTGYSAPKALKAEEPKATEEPKAEEPKAEEPKAATRSRSTK